MSLKPASQISLPAILQPLLLGTVFFLLFTGPIGDGDCFWHLANGRWIVEHSALPTSDPFSFTVTDHNPFRPESARIQFLLKQYWLGQMILYGSWQMAGAAGVVMLRATVYTVIILFIHGWTRRRSPGLPPLLFSGLLGLLLMEIPNERPQLFSFLFLPLLLWLLELSESKEQRWPLLLLPVVMILWANTHGSHIMGSALLALTLTARIIVSRRHREPTPLALLLAGTTSIVASLANPTGTLAWQEFFQTLPAYSATIYENLTPWYAAVQQHDLHPAYWCYLGIALVTISRAGRRIPLWRLLVCGSLLLLSLTGLRYLIFPLLAAPLLAPYLPELPVNRRLAMPILLGLAGWLAMATDGPILRFRADDSFPAAAVEFLRREQPAAELFNHYDWGGYLSWQLPNRRTFIDGRALVEEISLLQDDIINGNGWRESMDSYGINTVLIPGLDRASGVPLPLAELLAAAPDWRLVFADATALVFVRSTPPNQEVIARHQLLPLELYRHLALQADRLLAINPKREEYWLTKANALQRLGDRPGALAAYQRTLEINPRNEWAARMVAAGGSTP